MLSHENVPTTPSKRAPPVSLNVKTGLETTSYNDFSPRTPPSQIRHVGRSKGASKALNSRPALRETFLDDLTPVDQARDGGIRDDQDERDLHDLSLSPRHVTRNSVVDNMLLSLDQFSSRGDGAFNADEGRFHSTFDDDDPYTVNTRYASSKSVPRYRGHKYSSSYSSDYDPYTDDASSRYSSHYSRGRRSNSSSNFQTALPRIDSVRADKEGFNSKGKPFEAQRATAPGEPAFRTHSRGGRKGSKSSGSSSLDFGQMIGSSAWQRAIDRRSNSFDHGYTKGANMIPQSKFSTVANINHGRSQRLDSDFEAAPTPTVPVGPRRARSPPPAAVFPPQPAHPTPLSPVSARHNIIPSKDSYSRNVRSERPAYSSLRRRADESSTDRGMASILTGPSPAAPSPTVNYHKSSVTSTHGSTPQAKDRPGFFRRVFGSSKSTASTQNDIYPPQLPPMNLASSGARERLGSQGSHGQSHTPHAKLSKPQPLREPPAVPPKDATPQPLNKKPSLFFRRRKKSVSGIESPAVVPLHMHAKARDSTANPSGDRSPVSSLREVMNPYLHSPVLSPQDFHDSIEQQELSPIEMVKHHDPTNDAGKAPTSTSPPMSRMQDGDGTLLLSSYQDVASIVPDSPTISGQAKPDVARRDNHDNSFLQDSSDNDGRSNKTSPKSRSPVLRYRMENRRPSTTDNVTSSARDTQSKHENIQTRDPITVNNGEALAVRAREASTPHSTKLAKSLGGKRSTNSAANALDDDGWIVTPSKLKDDGVSGGNSSGRSSRVWIRPTTSEEQLNESSKLSPSLGGNQDPARASGSTISDYTSAKTSPVVQTVDKDHIGQALERGVNNGIPAQETDPSVEYREQARRIHEGDEEFVSKAGAAAWLGESGPERALVRKAYMDLFDWTEINILSALRGFCGKLILKGETQQVDRILDAFSTRWCQCNLNHGFKATGKLSIIPFKGGRSNHTFPDVVHTICYSIILLNTDLHLAEIEQKMTRGQFIKNTMPTIRRVAADAAPDGFETVRASKVPLRAQVPRTEPASPTAPTPSSPPEVPDSISTPDTKRPIHTLSTRPSDRSEYDTPRSHSLNPLEYDTPHDDCGPLVKAPFHGKSSTWELQVEIVLKDFFNSIRHQPLPLHGQANEPILDQPMPTNTLSAFTGSLLRRTPSTLSKAASETLGSRGRLLEGRLGTGRWTSKTRSRPRLIPASSMTSTRTSFDDESSIWSPSISSTWSKHSFNKTQTSMSVNSLASDYPQADYQQSIGFANALSQAIIREETAGSAGADEPVRVAPLLEDETLELAGAPWAKEGILKHKHHLEVVDKRAKDRNWNECFAVIEKGWMRLFSFNMNAKSMRLKAKSQRAPGGVVGGGNWSENAEALGTFMLRQTIASALPPPGYSKARPHVWALSLPSGAVHLFQVGTPEIVREFVTTANYWSARLSKEPLVGGVSNIEHGWGDAVINTALIHTDSMRHAPMGHSHRPSLHGSIRSSLDQGSVRPKLPGDKAVISDWSPPPQSMVASALMEVDQLRALTTYVKNIEDELQKHNELRGPMLLAVSPKSQISDPPL